MLLLLLLLLLLHPTPLEDPTSRGHIRAHGGSNLVRRVPVHTLLRNARARHSLLWGRRGDEPSASRRGDAQRAAKHGQQAK
eukprot:945325-Prymnesium_polylepis.1